MTDTYADLLACEDLLLFAGAAISSTGQQEFHGDADAQRLSLDFLHEYVHGTLPDLYALMLVLHVNDHNAARIVHTLLSRPRPEAPPEERARENGLIRRRLALMPPQRVYRLFARLAAERVNNRRTRAVMRDWIAGRALDLDALKYRAGLRAAARHARVPLPDEVARFLFSAPAARRARPYASSLLEAHRRAHYAARDLYDLPYSVAEGFAAHHRVPRAVFLEGIAARATRAERLRLDRTAHRHGLAPPLADLASVPLLRLCSYVLALSPSERRARRAELEQALERAALRTAGPLAGTWPRTAAVLDDSHSSTGSRARRDRPLALALACHHLVRALAPESSSHWVSGRTDALTARPLGPTPLIEPILDALETGPARVVVVSDGYDDTPPLLADALTLWRRRVDPDRSVTMVHLSPVWDADSPSPHRLSPAVPTIGLHDPAVLPSLVELARFGEGRLGLSELRGHLVATADTHLREGS
ncbi:hypothetical protein [Nocardiopsis lambiniae]|uniref:TROVE domain-containing protein n=1 Tax=Nocardiopsis lambiniae TaxID=3075539 RepID=A0ABU2M6L5_9ACTN|nr:hypothetical protein [Nocardiopsis sp. DSM 44743]MDT0328313.1 hypothetical protein [Nocardiopsis sp. DSM 44743]